jgi:hypothetical protein
MSVLSVLFIIPTASTMRPVDTINELDRARHRCQTLAEAMPRVYHPCQTHAEAMLRVYQPLPDPCPSHAEGLP